MDQRMGPPIGYLQKLPKVIDGFIRQEDWEEILNFTYKFG